MDNVDSCGRWILKEMVSSTGVFHLWKWVWNPKPNPRYPWTNKFQSCCAVQTTHQLGHNPLFLTLLKVLGQVPLCCEPTNVLYYFAWSSFATVFSVATALVATFGWFAYISHSKGFSSSVQSMSRIAKAGQLQKGSVIIKCSCFLNPLYINCSGVRAKI